MKPGSCSIGLFCWISSESMIWWPCRVGASPLPAVGQPHLCTKISSGPSAPGAAEHSTPPAPSHEEQQAFRLQPAAAEHTEGGDQYLSTITISFKCPQPPWLYICPPFLACFPQQEFTSFPSRTGFLRAGTKSQAKTILWEMFVFGLELLWKFWLCG